MSHAEPSAMFPRCELGPHRHQQIRDLLVREAGAVAVRSREPRRSRSRLAIPVAALAVVLAIVGSTVAVRALTGSSGTIPAPSSSKTVIPNSFDQQCVSEGTSIAPETAKDLLYLGPEPAGYSAPSFLLENGFSCYMGSDPVASFYKPDPTGPPGTFDAAVTVSHLADAPEKIAKWPNLAWRQPEADGEPPAKFVDVKVGSRPGKLTGGRILTWRAVDGQYWSMAGSGVTADRLVSIAAGLKLTGSKVSWPAAAAQGFTRLDVPARAPQMRSQDKLWSLSYRKKNCRKCSFSLDVDASGQQDQQPWQAHLGTLRMPARLVTVGGRPALLSEHGTFQEPNSRTGHELRLLTVDGADLWVIENTTGKRTDLVAWAEGLEKVAPDDPRLAKLRPGF